MVRSKIWFNFGFGIPHLVFKTDVLKLNSPSNVTKSTGNWQIILRGLSCSHLNQFVIVWNKFYFARLIIITRGSLCGELANNQYSGYSHVYIENYPLETKLLFSVIPNNSFRDYIDFLQFA